MYHDLRGYHRSTGIKQLDKRSINLRALVKLRRFYIKMIPAGHATIPDKKYLNHRLISVSGDSDDIPVAPVAFGDLLFFL